MIKRKEHYRSLIVSRCKDKAVYFINQIICFYLTTIKKLWIAWANKTPKSRRVDKYTSRQVKLVLRLEIGIKQLFTL
jgi:hypothetical protein